MGEAPRILLWAAGPHLLTQPPSLLLLARGSHHLEPLSSYLDDRSPHHTPPGVPASCPFHLKVTARVLSDSGT